MRKIASLLVSLLLLCVLSAPAFAAGMDDAELPNIVDDVSLLTEEEQAALNQKAESISNKYRCAVYLVAVDDYLDYGGNTFDAARGIYKSYKLGYGEGQDGILLLLSMDARDFELITYGYGNEAFTDYGMTSVIDAFSDAFAEDDWYAGTEDYLDECARLLMLARSGKPFDASSDPDALYAGIFFCTLLGLIIALIVRSALKAQMRSVAKAAQADSYIPEEGAEITQRSDTYTHSTETRRKIEKSSSGGGSRHSGGGFSGRSGKF